MNYGKPHQSRERHFDYTPNLNPPTPPFPGDVDELMAFWWRRRLKAAAAAAGVEPSDGGQR
jgi:hypothetical protein